MTATPDAVSLRTTANSTSISASVRMADGSSRMSTVASPASALAIDTCCCSAIDSVADRHRRVARRQAQQLEQLDDLGVLLRPGDPAAVADLAAGEDVLRDRELGEQLRLLVHGGDAEGDGVAGRRDRDRRALELDRAGVRRSTPEMILIMVDLPAPFSPTSACTRARLDGDLGAADRADGAEALGDPPQLQARVGGCSAGCAVDASRLVDCHGSDSVWRGPADRVRRGVTARSVVELVDVVLGDRQRRPEEQRLAGGVVLDRRQVASLTSLVSANGLSSASWAPVHAVR